MSSSQDVEIPIDFERELDEEMSTSAPSTSTKYEREKRRLQQLNPAQREEFNKKKTNDKRKLRERRRRVAMSTLDVTSMSGLSELSGGSKRGMAGETDVNLTIYQLRERWMQLSPDHANKEKGMAVLNLLMEGTYGEEVKTEQLQLKSRVTAGDVMFDVLKYEGSFRNVLNGYEVEQKDGSKEEFIIAWNAMGEDMSQNPAGRKFTPYSALMVPSNNKQRGLGAAIGSTPSVLSRASVWVKRGNDGWPDMNTAVTPAGSITSLHEDGKGAGQILVVMYGWKVLMWWEDSDELREKYRPYHATTKGDMIVAAVRNWPGLKWACMGPRDYIEMKPGCIHAVITPVNSAISGWAFIQPEWVTDGTLRSGMNEELSILWERIEARSEDDDNLEACIGVVEGELEKWRDWKRRGALERDVSQQLQLLIKDVEKELTEVKEAYKNS